MGREAVDVRRKADDDFEPGPNPANDGPIENKIKTEREPENPVKSRESSNSYTDFQDNVFPISSLSKIWSLIDQEGRSDVGRKVRADRKFEIPMGSYDLYGLSSCRDLLLALQQQQQQELQHHHQQQMALHAHHAHHQTHQHQHIPEHLMMHHVPQMHLLREEDMHMTYGRMDQSSGNKRKAPSSPPSSARKKPAFNEHKAKRAEGPPQTPLWSVQMVSIYRESCCIPYQ